MQLNYIWFERLQNNFQSMKIEVKEWNQEKKWIENREYWKHVEKKVAEEKKNKIRSILMNEMNEEMNENKWNEWMKWNGNIKIIIIIKNEKS